MPTINTSIPSKLRDKPLPDPVGIGATGIANALVGSACWAKPFRTSCTNPSPETVTTASKSRLEFLAISSACPDRVVSMTGL